MLEDLDQTESEEHVKNDLIVFLNEVWYKDQHHINTKDRTDLVIHQDKSPKSKPAVLLEVKKPGNKSEMVTRENFNGKALQELLLYYLRERIDQDNNEIKHLIVTNVFEWFIFDATEFYEHFYKNKALIKAYKGWAEGQMDSARTDLFYKEIASKFIDEEKDLLNYTWFDLRDYQKYLKKSEDASPLITLYKVLSPEHLLKKPFANDSNSLNKQFYHELLHIIGLEEVKDGGKKVIQRKEKGKRNEGSLLENAIDTMDEKERLQILERPSHFGATNQEQLYAVGLELCITWINRILFLKLLESQLVGYHRGDQSYRFLNTATVSNYDALESLFFGVLAKKLEERHDRYKEKYAKVPYLNSSLFEPTGLEQVLTITMLNNNLELELYSQTVLKDTKGNRLKGKMDTLSYLFAFLEAYDFSSEGKEEIQEESKSLINASVLGLIFEKINGYKDGSFYTPGFITMYMCRETLRRAVVQKFNEAKGWSLETFDQLYDKIEDKKEANAIINSLKICDPAVGSGHFLVSALNELIAIKSDLKILLDRNGKTLRDYGITIENDELIIEDDNQELFQYVVGSKEKQRIQETLFHEKQTLIENCLFGVDINPNSVKICRLRLWIELLKNAYYKSEDELETLPNIDINIKTGNSLISRFDLDSDLKDALRNSKWDINSYKTAVASYKNATRKEDKREFERLINSIKNDFQSKIETPLKSELKKARGQLDKQLTDLNTKKQWGEKIPADLKKKVEKAEARLLKLINQRDEIESNRIYEDAFEWRFEFPEVLDDQGHFVGFDVVIGNPPYIRIQDLQQYEGIVEHYSNNYQTGQKGNYDIYVLFVELGLKLSLGKITYILPHKFINASYGDETRRLISNRKAISQLVHFGAEQVFEDATTYTCLLFLENVPQEFFLYNQVDSLLGWREDNYNGQAKVPIKAITSIDWKLLSESEYQLLEKLNDGSKSLEQVTTRIFQGIKTSADKIYIVEEIKHHGFTIEVRCPHDGKEYELESGLLHRLIKGGDSKRYYFRDSSLLVLFPYSGGKLIDEVDLSKKYPLTYKYLNAHKEYLENRENGKMEGDKWYGYVYPKALDVIGSQKIFTPDIAPRPSFMIDETGDKYFTGGAAGGYGIVSVLNNNYLLGLLNSSLTNWYISKTSTQMRGGWYSFESRFIKSIPVKNQENETTKKIAKTVESILFYKSDDSAFDTSEKEREIDQLVYELYGLTEEEIGIIEQSVH